MADFLRNASDPYEVALGLWSNIGDPLLVEAMAYAGPDYVCIDMQHGTANDGDLVSLLQGVESGGSTPLVRVTHNSPALIMKALDAGAFGVIVPLVETANEAASAVQACRYPPEGRRSFGPFRAALRTADPRQLEKVACFIMIETSLGLENLADIAATDGLAGIYIGPSDLSLALGLPPGSFQDPNFISAANSIRDACDRHGIVTGIHCYDGATAADFISKGFRMATVAVDLRLIRSSVAIELQHARSALAGHLAREPEWIDKATDSSTEFLVPPHK